MSEMVERVAKDLYLHSLVGRGSFGSGSADFMINPPSWLTLDEDERRKWRFYARAAIEAMREPTDWFIDTPRGKQIMADRNAAYRKACIQTNCADKGVDESHCGVCAFCADIADDIIETHSNTIIDAALKD